MAEAAQVDVDDVVAGTAVDLLHEALALPQDVVAVAEQHEVGNIAADHDVIAGPGVDRVLAVSGGNPVVPAIAE